VLVIDNDVYPRSETVCVYAISRTIPFLMSRRALLRNHHLRLSDTEIQVHYKGSVGISPRIHLILAASIGAEVTSGSQ
jgi:hypothetical protein